MRDQQHRAANLALQGFDQAKNLRLDRDIQRRGRLVGDQQLRPAHERHRDHGSLAHAAGQLVRILRVPLFDVRNADFVQHLERQPARRRRADVLLHENRLVDLIADGVHRRECRHRLLKDHAHEAAPYAEKQAGLFVQFGNVDLSLPLRPQHDPAVDDPARRLHKLKKRVSRDAFPAARLSHQRERAAALDRERHVLHCAHHAVGREERHAQVAHLEQRCFGGKVHFVAYGSAASRKPSPRKLKLSTVRTIRTTGINSQG